MLQLLPESRSAGPSRTKLRRLEFGIITFASLSSKASCKSKGCLGISTGLTLAQLLAANPNWTRLHAHLWRNLTFSSFSFLFVYFPSLRSRCSYFFISLLSPLATEQDSRGGNGGAALDIICNGYGYVLAIQDCVTEDEARDANAKHICHNID